eukprot:Skav235524  [mRNA]  locus=scaffold625:1163763:1166551:- [translate_table: standard]
MLRMGTSQKVTHLLKKISSDGDEVVSFEELLGCAIGDGALDQFVEFYTKLEEDGKLNDEQADLVKVTRSQSHNDALHMAYAWLISQRQGATFRAWDKDQSGKLSKREFFSVPWRPGGLRVMKSLNKAMTDAKITLLYAAA